MPGHHRARSSATATITVDDDIRAGVFSTARTFMETFDVTALSVAISRNSTQARPVRRRRSVTLLIVWLAVLPATAHAQDPQADPTEQRPTGLPSRITWTFNLDAGWGTFGFANSLFDNPKEPGVDENLSDQWFEGYAKPALSADYTTSSSGVIYGKVSVVGERTYGSMPEAFGQDVSSFGPEDLYIGWKSGGLAATGEDVVDVSVGREQDRIGHGLLIFDGAAEGGSRGGYWTNARKAFEFAAIGRFRPGAHTAEAFYLDKDELEEVETGSRLWGFNYEYRIGEETTLGATYMKWWADSAVSNRAGTGWTCSTFVPTLRRSPSSPICRSSSSTSRSATVMSDDSNAWTLQSAYELSAVPWKPTLSYRYAFFQGDDPGTIANEAFDPLFVGFYDWGTWWQGEIAGEVLPRQLQLDLPSCPGSAGAAREHRHRAAVLQVPRRPPGIVRSRRVRPRRCH